MTDFFIAPGLSSGDGSRERPFHDPWVALKYAEPGDRLHLASGTYTGRFERSSWVIDCPEVTLLGGYSPDFTTRTPWRTPSILGARPGLRVPREPNMLQGLAKHDGTILDGLFFDGAGRNDYDADGALQGYHYGDGPLVSLRGERITIRHCVFANGSAGAVELGGNGGRFENNTVVNFAGSALLTVRDHASAGGMVVSRNTFCFAHDESDPPRGSGADRAIGVRVKGAATIADNVFVGCGNAAIACFHDLAQIAIDRNLFFATLRDVVRSRVQSAEAEITEEYVAELEDAGLQSAVGNIVADPHLTGLPVTWVDAYTVDIQATYARPPVAALNTLRASVGLGGLPGTPGGATAPVMRCLTSVDVLAMGCDAAHGARPLDLPIEQTFQAPRPIPAYRPIDWARLTAADPALSGTPVEIRAGLGFDQSIDLLPDLGTGTHTGIAVYEPGKDDQPVYLVCARHSFAHRQLEEAIRYSRGLDVEITYLVRGTYRTDVAAGARQPTTIVVDSIAVAPAAPVSVAPAATGHDWYVRAGASGGDGGRETPFKDPFQAMEKAAEGDRIHIAEGEYSGRLRSGAWRIPAKHLTMLGGYSADFTTRDPWRHPVRFVLNPETRAKGRPGDPVLSVEDSADGLVLDGFVFDGSTYNLYADNGALDAAHSHSAALLDLRGGGGTLEVRNCAFVNAADVAVQLSSGSGVFENNVVVNTSGTAVRIHGPGAGPWIVRGNTIMFAADPTGRASSGRSNSGCLLDIGGRAQARVESNVLAFAEGVALRVTIPPQNLALDGNVITANLCADVSDTAKLLVGFDSWERITLDAPLGSLTGNRTELPALPVDGAFGQVVIGRLATLPATLPAERLRAAATVLGVNLPALGAPDPKEDTEAPAAPTGESSLSDLLAGLRTAKEEFEAADTATSTTEAVVYCPIYPVTAALSLAADAQARRES